MMLTRKFSCCSRHHQNSPRQICGHQSTQTLYRIWGLMLECMYKSGTPTCHNQLAFSEPPTVSRRNTLCLLCTVVV